MAKDLDKLFGVGGHRGPLPDIERRVVDDFDKFLEDAQTQSDPEVIRAKVSRQITLGALSGLMLPKMIFPIRQQVQRRSEDGQSPL